MYLLIGNNGNVKAKGELSFCTQINCVIDGIILHQVGKNYIDFVTNKAVWVKIKNGTRNNVPNIVCNLRKQMIKADGGKAYSIAKYCELLINSCGNYKL